MLYQLSYFRKNRPTRTFLPSVCGPPSPAFGRRRGICPTRFALWEEMDSNHRRRKPADLQSAPFGHSGIFPIFQFCRPPLRVTPPAGLTPLLPFDSFPTGCRADGGIRTPDQLITNQLLWPTELHRQRAFWIAKVEIKNQTTKNFR